MAVYDFMVGKSLNGTVYQRATYLNRFAMEDSDLASIKQVTKLIHDQLVIAWANIDKSLGYQIDILMKDLGVLVTSGDINSEAKLRESLSCFSALGYEINLIRRPDLTTTEVIPGTRAYMIDKNDNLFPTLNRVTNGQGLTFEESTEASLPAVVMTFVNSVMSFNPTTEEVISLRHMKESYNALEKAHAGWQYDIKPLQDFLSDYGYKFIVCLG